MSVLSFPRALFTSHVLPLVLTVVLFGASVAGCSENEPALTTIAADVETVTPAPSKAASKAAASKRAARTSRPSAATARSRPAGDAPPMLGQAKPANGIRMNVDIQDGNERTRASVTSEFGGVGININVTDDKVSSTVKKTSRRTTARTCKKALLANGHAAVHLVHCEDVNDTCAVALLNAGNPPSSLVHCSDVTDVGCAVQLLKRGGRPSEIVHCD